MFKYTLVFSLAAFLCLALTPWIVRLASTLGAIDRPDPRRVHSTPTPRLGGLAVFASIAMALGGSQLVDPWLRPESRDIPIFVMATAAVMFLGLIDDCFSIKPSLKLLVEIVVALATFATGYRITEILGWDLGWAAAPVTVLWIVTLTNAFNLIDGLDGLATGTGAIISATLFALCVYDSHVPSALILAALCGSLFGFLPYNFFPAKIFLGDSGSLLLGFIFALISIRIADKSSAALAISIPLLALGFPLGEMTLTITRRLLRVVHVIRGEPEGARYEFFFLGRAAVFTADRAHIHHRLIDLGLNHRSAVLLLYGVCSLFCGGALALIFQRGGQEGLILGIFGIATIVGVRHLDYKEFRPLRNGLLLPLLDAPIFNLMPFQVLLDIGSITAAYMSSNLICSHALSTSQLTPVAIHTLPLVCFAQISAFAVSGLYRRTYRLSGIAELLALIKALVIAAVLGWTASSVVFSWQPYGLSIALLDSYILGTLIVGWRFSFSVLEHYFQVDRVPHTFEDATVSDRRDIGTRTNGRNPASFPHQSTTRGVAGGGGL
jgi:UDP-GlcNAc:undecaprenyl-phosphate/decaprenyl-phosphate GlcNAc-1-phosphate transferase